MIPGVIYDMLTVLHKQACESLLSMIFNGFRSQQFIESLYIHHAIECNIQLLMSFFFFFCYNDFEFDSLT